MNNIPKGPLTSKDADAVMDKLRKDYQLWRIENTGQKQTFFIIYKKFLDDNHLRNLSGNSVKLYLYLGFHSNNKTGESWHSIEAISNYFNCDERTIKRWFKELEDHNLIKRIQKGYKRVANTFLIPY